jgi:hypothetical protein
MLAKNKFVQYLTYALGEIILVVIGILIALQINNWNENRKLKLKEVASIQNLVEEIGFNNNILKTVNEVDSTSLVFGKKMLASLKNINSKYKDSMSYDFEKMLDDRIFISRRTAYENLKSIDFNVIKSDTVRMNISFIYDGLYSYLDNEQNNNKKEFSKKLSDLIQNNFEKMEVNGIIPNNYEALKKNKNFTNVLSFYIYSKQVSYEQNVGYYLWLEKIRLEIEDYLAEIKNKK